MSGAPDLDRLSTDERRALLARLLAEDAASDKSYPVSFAQRRLWFLTRLSPSTPVYNIPVAIRLRGTVHVPLLIQSLKTVVGRHEALRTTFAQPDPTADPVQVVRPVLEIAVPCSDLTPLAVDGREAEMLRRARAEATRPFDLERGPLLRAEVLTLADDDHLLLVHVHHIIVEPWSIGVLLRELGAAYRALSHGTSPSLPELALQYGDFARWDRRRVSDGRQQQHLRYWQEQLADGVPLLSLPADRSRPAAQSFAGAFRARPLGRPLMEAAAALARSEGATLYMVLLTAFVILLYRYASARDVSIGVAVSDRGRRELEPLIGLFLNTIVLRFRIDGDPTCRELLAHVRGLLVNGLAHQEAPLEHVVERVQPERDPGRNPLFQVMFGIEEETSPALDLGGNVASEMLPPELIHNGTSKVDLSLLLRQSPAGLTAGAEYSTDLFDGSTIDRLLEHFETLLWGLVREPDSSVSDAPMLPAHESRQIRDWSASRSDYPRDRTVHRLFEEHVRLTPGAPALVGAEQLTYQGLNRRANRVARRLREVGVGIEDVVGVHLDRSVDMVVTLLASLKVGAAYLPLDPSYPIDRLRFMVEDSSATAIVTRTTDASIATAGCTVVGLDEIDQRTEFDDDHDVSIDVDPQNLAYVMYTSGSTGTPKGTRVTHRGIVRLVCETNVVTIGPEDVFLQLVSFSCDASTFEIWGPLLNGARLALFPPGTPSLSALNAEIQARRVTVLRLTASLYNEMVDAYPDGLHDVRQLLVGGEALSVSHTRAGLKQYRGTRIINGYGPTENTGLTTCYSMTDPDEVGRSVPIGYPVSNTTVYLLDQKLQPVPIGVPGELYTGGDGLARDYVGRPDLTAERFLPDPFSDEAGARMYRTGDRARYLPDGRIEFLGRLDRQVKIRGFRVEPGEVEACLTRHPAVRHAAVVARGETSSQRSLVAYVQPTGTTAPPDLRLYLSQRLPAFMVPSGFEILERMPLLPNGKVDRHSLPDARIAPVEPVEVREELRSDVERTIAEIWRNVLRVDSVGRDDNFFDIGGHSLLLIQVLTRLERVFSRDVPLVDLFRHPTIAELAPLFEPSGEAAAPAPAAEEPSGGARGGVEAFYFGKQDAHLFGCYHSPQASRHRRTGIVICQSMGHEYINYHRACRDLAQGLAERGFPVLRFDYYGTGDSAGDSADGNIEHWVHDVGLALAELRQRGECEEVSIIGFRLGGALATLAAVADGGCAHLVLWDPVVKGARLVAELDAEMRAALRKVHTRVPASLRTDFPSEALGFPMPNRRWEDLRRLDLLQVDAEPADRVLIIDSRPDDDDARFVQRLTSLGSAVDTRRIPVGDGWAWSENVSRMEYPRDVVGSVFSWLDEAGS